MRKREKNEINDDAQTEVEHIRKRINTLQNHGVSHFDDEDNNNKKATNKTIVNGND